MIGIGSNFNLMKNCFNSSLNRLIDSGNVHIWDYVQDFNCAFSGYFQYSQFMTNMRKSSKFDLYWNDYDFIFKSPGSKAKNPNIIHNKEEWLDVSKKYYVKLYGVSQKKTPPSMYIPKYCYGGFLIVSPAVYATLSNQTWNVKPPDISIDILSLQGKTNKDWGKYHMYSWPDLPSPDDSNPDVYDEDVDTTCKVFPFSDPDIFDNPLIVERKKVAGFKDNIVFYKRRACFFRPPDDTYRVEYNYFFDINAVEALVKIDSNFVFSPLYTVENIGLLRKRISEPSVRKKYLMLSYQKFCERNNFNLEDYVSLGGSSE